MADNRTARAAVALGTATLAAAVPAGLRLVAARQARRRNAVRVPGPYRIPEPVRAVHERLAVADLHADSLLWGRSLLRRGRYGHADLPRLQEANVTLQVFAAVTQVPAGLNFERNERRRDLITLLAVAQGWPPRTWRNRLQRALYAAERLRRLADRSGGRLLLIESAADLDLLQARRRSDRNVLGALLAIEGSHALEGRLENLDVLADAGYRMIGLQHFFDNEAGGSAHGISGAGLSPFGRELVQAVQAKRLALDLAHSSPQVVDDVLGLAGAPLFFSHGGLRGTADNQRNLTDEQARGIARTGGLIGIAMFAHAVGGGQVEDTARAMRYGADLVGVEHIALGSDFDGAVQTPTDVTGLPLLTGSLLEQGFGESEVAAIMGGNVLRVLRRVLG